MVNLKALSAVYWRNLKLIQRRPGLAAQTLLLPTAVLLLVAFVFGGGGDEWPVAVVDDSGGPLAAEVVASLKEASSQITPYFDVLDAELDEARSDVRKGRLHMLVHIPRDFESTRRLKTEVFNINTDATKNVRLRLDYALNAVDEVESLVETKVEFSQEKHVWRSAYIGGGSVLLALLLGTTLTAANLVVVEHEQRTYPEIRLSPIGWLTAGGGIVLTSITVAVVASMVPLGASVLLFNLQPEVDELMLAFLASLPLLVGLAGLGALLGEQLRSFRTVQPLIVMAALVTFFGGGGFVGVAMLQPAAQAFADWWIPSRVFRWLSPVLHGFSPGFTPVQLGWISFVGGLGAGLIWVTDRISSHRPPSTSI